MIGVYIVLAAFAWLALAEFADWFEENVIDWHNR